MNDPQPGPIPSPQVAALLDGLTPEQQTAVWHWAGPLLVFAGPGAGKTNTLTRRIARLLADGVPAGQILAVTFTVAAAGEMRLRLMQLLGEEAVRGLTVCTFHSVCVRILRDHSAACGRGDAFTIYDQFEVKKIINHVSSDADRAAIQQQVQRFGDPPADVALKEISLAKNRLWDPAFYEAHSPHPIAPLIAAIWREVDIELHQSNAMDFDDLLVYTARLLASSQAIGDSYRARWRWVLVDEFQDTNYAQLALVQLLAGQAGNLTVVADDDQCLLEGTPVRMGDGTVKAIEDVAVGDEVLSAIGAGRFAARRVTRTVRRQAADGVGLELVDGRELVSTGDHTHFAAFDAATLDGRFVTYLMFKRGVGYRVGMARGCYWVQGQPRLGAAHRVLHERAQAAWILTVHETEEQARILEAVVAATYGLPTLPFRKTAGASSGLCSNQTALDAVHATIDSDRGAKRLAGDLGLRLEYPHVRPQSVSGRFAPGTQPTRLVRVTLCGHRASQVHHLVRAYGTDAAGAEALESAGHKVRHYRGRWEFAAAGRDYGQALKLGREIAHLLGGEVYEAMSVGGGRRRTRTLPLINAADVRPGMVVATEEGQLVEVAQVEPVVLDRPVYDLDVDGSHNFVANGIVTHNCLYKFRGAEPDNVLRFTESFPTACSVTLGRNFRSHSEIVELAGRSIEHNTRRVHKEFVAHRGPGGKVECWAFASDVDEAEWIAHQMSEALAAGVGHEEIMAIAGTNFATNRLQHTLASYGIAHRVLGALGLFERREVKDAMAYLQLLGNPQDAQAFRRAISSPRRGVGAATANRIIEAARAGDGDLVAACVNLPNIGRVPKATRDKLALFGQEILRLRDEQQAGRSVGHIVTGSVAMAGGIVRYHQEIRDGQDASNADRRDAERVLEDLRSLCRAAHHHDETDPQPSLTAFLEQAALTTTVDVDGPDERITISTIHKAKGTEASLVFVLGCEEGLLPSGKALEEGDELTIEEQRRLFYVAATRAKDRLVLTMAHQRNDRPTDGPSRFLREAGAF